MQDVRVAGRERGRTRSFEAEAEVLPFQSGAIEIGRGNRSVALVLWVERGGVEEGGYQVLDG